MVEELAPPPPALFTAEGTSALPGHPALLGGRCQSCGFVFFPMQSYGCDNCGSTDLAPSALSGRGKLIASAEVHVPAGKHRPAPFTVGAIITDDGAKLRVILDVPPGQHLKNGTMMVTRLVPETRPNRGEFDLRFAPETAGE